MSCPPTHPNCTAPSLFLTGWDETNTRPDLLTHRDVLHFFSFFFLTNFARTHAQIMYDDGTDEEVSFPEPTIRFVDGGGGGGGGGGAKKVTPATTSARKTKKRKADTPAEEQEPETFSPSAVKKGSPSPRKPSTTVQTASNGKNKKKKMGIASGDKTVTDGQCDKKLWSANDKIKAPARLPSHLKVLETFAGAGGLHMCGTARFGNTEVSIQSVAAIDIVKDPCDTYKHNFPDVNVMHIGISRFIATGRRLQRLKGGKAPSAAALEGSRIEAIINFRITEEVGT